MNSVDKYLIDQIQIIDAEIEYITEILNRELKNERTGCSKQIQGAQSTAGS